MRPIVRRVPVPGIIVVEHVTRSQLRGGRQIGPMEGIIVDLEHAGTSVATLCTVRGHTSVGKAIVPDNGPRSEFSVRRAASGPDTIAYYRIIFHEEELVRSEP